MKKAIRYISSCIKFSCENLSNIDNSTRDIPAKKAKLFKNTSTRVKTKPNQNKMPKNRSISILKDSTFIRYKYL